MTVLGIDPGTASVGYGIVESSGGRLRRVDHGCLVTRPDISLPQRLLAIHAFVVDLVARHAPAVVAVERVFFQRNAQSAIAVGQARGVVLLAAAQAGVPVREATPSEVKLAVTGHGRADKAQVQRMVAVLLAMPEVPTPDDAADALAIAIWATHTEHTMPTAGAALLDRSAVDPLDRTTSPYDRVVREALRAERAAGPGEAPAVRRELGR